MKRFIALLLALLMVAPMFACANDSTGSGNESKPQSSQSSSGNGDDVPPNFDDLPYLDKLILGRDKVSSGLPEYDADGQTVQIDCLFAEDGQNYTADWIMSEEFNSDPMNNALYDRLIAIEEGFDVNLEFLYLGDDNYITARTTVVQSGLGDVDIIGVAPWATRLALEGIFDDMANMPYLDFSRPWWFTDTIKDFSLDGHSVIAFGSVTPVSIFGGTEAVFFNQQLCEDNGIEDLYNVVRQNRWDYEYLYKITKIGYIEKDGIDGYTEGDQYGFKYNPSFIRMFWNLGGKYCVIDEETGTPKGNVNTPLNEEIFDKCRQLLSIYEEKVDGLWFGAGRVLLYSTNLTMIEDTGAFEFDVGVIPLPKLNSDQENYVASGYFAGAGITIDATDPEVTALVLEALAYYGWYGCVPKYYETIIKYKHSSNPQNAEMLDLMYSNMQYDPIWMYERETIDYLGTFIKSSSGFSSFIKRKAAVTDKRIETNVKTLRGHMDRLFK